MKKLVKGLLFLLFLFLLLGTIGYFYAKSTLPQYSGNLSLNGLQAPVEVLFDDYGVPHIYAENEEDLYRALGYVHAQERLFQMEFNKRIAQGKLAEILGDSLLSTDRFFRALGLEDAAEKMTASYLNDAEAPYQKMSKAYLDGINQFIERGKTPLEFTILGIPKEKFETKDIYLTTGFMALGFAEGFREEPFVWSIQEKLGAEYLKDLQIGIDSNTTILKSAVPANLISMDSSLSQAFLEIQRIFDELPAPPFIGSNSWVVGPDKSTTGQVILCNDTHIQYSQPSVWFEAHLECPGFSFYGNHLAGLPFGPVGNNRKLGWGVTMFENDDTDFYLERRNPENPRQVWATDHWEDLQVRQEIIQVKDGKTDTLLVEISRHGPLMGNVMERFGYEKAPAVALWWTFLKNPGNLLKTSYDMSHASNMEEFATALSGLGAPGLNITYGDKAGNIGWWAAAHLVKRPAHVNSKSLLDGASGKDDPLGFYDFSENPHVINPPAGFVYSANNQSQMPSGKYYPGYFCFGDRASSIENQLAEQEKWSIKDLQKLFLYDRSPSAQLNVATFLKELDANQLSERETEAFQLMAQWDGGHGKNSVGATIYNKMLALLLEIAMKDEMKSKKIPALTSGILIRRSLQPFISNPDNPWWDDINTEQKESRGDIIKKVFTRSIQELEAQLGSDIQQWQWSKVHTLTHTHVIGRQPPFDKVFNVGPLPNSGSNEVINAQGFALDTDGEYEVVYGPALRNIINFADIGQSWGILPTGQSGHLLSPHYDDQAQMFVDGKHRHRWMDREDIEKVQKGKLVFKSGK